MFIVYVTGISMGKRFDDAKEMGIWISLNVKSGSSARVELFV